MARFMIQWCAPDPTNEHYTKAIVDNIKGGKPMDEFAGFSCWRVRSTLRPVEACSWWKLTILP